VNRASSTVPLAQSKFIRLLVHVRSSLIQGLFLLPARVAEIAMNGAHRIWHGGDHEGQQAICMSS